jgi:hypothetical protein
MPKPVTTDPVALAWGRNIARQRQIHTPLNDEDGHLIGAVPRLSGADPVLSQAQLGQLFDPPVAQSTIARWEKGAEPRRRHKVQLARILHVEVTMLFPLIAA